MSEQVIRVELYSGPDARGRYTYALIFRSKYRAGERGQVFFGIPPTHLAAISKDLR